MGATKKATPVKASGGHGDAYSGAISNRAIQKKKDRMAQNNTERGLDVDTRTSCEIKTDSTLGDWGIFVLCFVALYAAVGGIFALFLELFMLTRQNDGTLWIWFMIQTFFISFLIVAIHTNPVAGITVAANDIENPGHESKTQ